MVQTVINYWAVIVAAIANMALGFLWYGPLFGKQWIALMKWTPQEVAQGAAKMKKEGWKTYGLAMIGSLVMALLLDYVVIFAGAYHEISGIELGVRTGFFVWLGFVATVTLGSVLWEGRSWKLWALLNSYYLVALLIMGCILAMWV